MERGFPSQTAGNRTLDPIPLLFRLPINIKQTYANHDGNGNENVPKQIVSCIACVYRVMDVRGKFEEHERSVRADSGAADSNSSFLSALHASQVHS